MLSLRSSRQKRSNSAASKHKHPLLPHDINFSQPYPQQKRPKRWDGSTKLKGKQNKKVIVGIGFPRQAVKFKPIDLNSRRTAQQQWQEAKLLDKYSFEGGKYMQEGSSTPAKEGERDLFEAELTIEKEAYTECTWKSLPAQIQKEYLGQFKQAIEKVFRGLDIFNRGTISETNINKWIPEEALYFLGNIFQNIRQERLHLSSEQFLSKCLPVLYQATEEDIQQFLNSVNGKVNIHTVSIGSEQKDKDSTVQLRIDQTGLKREEPREKSTNKYIPLIPFEEIIGNIKQQEKNICLKLTAQKQNYQSVLSRTNKELQPSQRPLAEKVSTNEPVKVAQFSSHHMFSSQKKVNLVDETAPYFNFQVSPKRASPLDRRPLKENPRPKNESGEQFKMKGRDLPNFEGVGDISFKDCLKEARPKTSRIIHQKISKDPVVEPLTQREKARETDKLDRLSNKLEEYIRFNRHKIESQRNFIRENSASK